MIIKISSNINPRLLHKVTLGLSMTSKFQNLTEIHLFEISREKYMRKKRTRSNMTTPMARQLISCCDIHNNTPPYNGL